MTIKISFLLIMNLFLENNVIIRKTHNKRIKINIFKERLNIMIAKTGRKTMQTNSHETKKGKFFEIFLWIFLERTYEKIPMEEATIPENPLWFVN